MIKNLKNCNSCSLLPTQLHALNVAPEIFSDKQLLELLFYYILKEKEGKDLAERLIDTSGNFNNLLRSYDIENVKKVTPNIKAVLLIMRESLKRTLSQEITNKNILNSFEALIEYLQFSMGSLTIEQIRILYLNKKNILIKEEIIANGTIDHIYIYPREIVKKALINEASSIILIHNHPSGCIKPSVKDIKLTSKIVNACNTVNIKLLDHIIISKGEYYSFKKAFTKLKETSQNLVNAKTDYEL